MNQTRNGLLKLSASMGPTLSCRLPVMDSSDANTDYAFLALRIRRNVQGEERAWVVDTANEESTKVRLAADIGSALT